MADVLSQSEIDALLSALSTGELEPEEVGKDEEKHKVKLYDFRSPQKFSKEHIRTLELVHDNYARIISLLEKANNISMNEKKYELLKEDIEKTRKIWYNLNIWAI